MLASTKKENPKETNKPREGGKNPKLREKQRKEKRKEEETRGRGRHRKLQREVGKKGINHQLDKKKL